MIRRMTVKYTFNKENKSNPGKTPKNQGIVVCAENDNKKIAHEYGNWLKNVLVALDPKLVRMHA